MILITGAAGKTGRTLIKALTRRGDTVRALLRRPEDAAEVRACGAAEVALGDLMDAESIQRALQGIDAVYLICPNMAPLEVEMGRIALQAARQAKVRHFVYHSVLHPQVEAMPHHWNKMRVEELLFSSGLDFTILQPTAYMQNVLAYWRQITTEGLYALPYAPESRLSLVDLADVAEVASAVIGQPHHFGATYELVGTAPLSQHQVAEAFSAVLNHPVRAAAIDRAAWEERARQSGMSDYAVTTLRLMFEYYERYGLWGSPQALTSLLGRAPTIFEDFLKRAVQSLL